MLSKYPDVIPIIIRFPEKIFFSVIFSLWISVFYCIIGKQ